MSTKDWDSDDWFMFVLFGSMVLITIVGIIVSGCVDFHENAVITHCIDAGKTWRDGNCE